MWVTAPSQPCSQAKPLDKMTEPSNHIVLVGDSVFDNKLYVPPGGDVIALLRQALPPGWQASLVAVDGSRAADVERQVADVPATATHVVLSMGGNDGLHNIDMIDFPAASSGAVLDEFRVRIDAFERAYRLALARVLALGCQTTVCTIYNANLDASEAERTTSTVCA